MAEIVKTVKIETGSGERSVKSLKKEISDLRDALLNMEKGSEDWVKTANELTKAQDDLNSVMKAGKTAADENGTSIASMEARYKSLYNTYKLLSQEQRKTAEGMSMQKELAELSKNLNETKKAAGNFKDNIGHYADDMMNAFGQLGISVGSLQGPFKLAAAGTKPLKTALDLIAKHPFLTVAAALIGLLKKVSDAIKGNEELQQRMNKVMAAFKPIGDVMAKILDRIASIAVSVAEGIAKVVNWVNNLFTATRKLSEAERELAQMENDLVKQRREVEESNSSDEARIAQLQEQASLTDDMREKEQLLTKARELQIKVNERNVALRQQEYDIIKKTNEITPSSTEDLNRESAALVALNNAREEGDKKVRKLNNSIKTASNAANKGADEAKKKLDEILKRLEDNTKTELQTLEEKYREEKALLVKYHKDTTALDEEYERNRQAIRYKYQREIINGYRQLEQGILDSYVQPSSKAFSAMTANAEAELQRFLDAAKQVGENFPPKITEAMVKENGKLTEAAKNIADTFGIELTDNMDFETIERTLNTLIAKLTKDINDAKNAQAEWNREIEKGRAELELQIRTYEENASVDLLYGDLDNLTRGMAEVTQAEEKFYRERGETMKKEVDRLNAVQRKANEQALNELKMNAEDKKVLDLLYSEAKEKLEQELTDKEKKMYEERARNIEETYKKINETQLKFYEEGLNALGLTLNDDLELRKEYYDSLEQLRLNDLENQETIRSRERELENERFQAIDELHLVTLDSVSSIIDSYKEMYDALKRDGELTAKEAEKKKAVLKALEAVQLGVALSTIVADTAAAWMSIDKSKAAEYVLNAETAAAAGPGAAAMKAALDLKTNAVAALRKAAIVANGIASATAAVGKTVSALKGLNEQYDSEGAAGGAVSASAPQIIDSTPYSYTRELQTDIEREEQLNTPIYVRVTDIESAQARVKVIDRETTY